MSSMDGIRTHIRRKTGAIFAPALLASLLASTACHASDGSDWDTARAQLIASQPSAMSAAIDKWRQLSESDRFAFTDYANFLAVNPGFPDEEKVRRNAERALAVTGAESARIVGFFDRFAPLSNPARAQYALALRAMGRMDAAMVGKSAWRGGPMSPAAESAILSAWGSTFTTDDHNARIDALLWAGASSDAQRM